MVFCVCSCVKDVSFVVWELKSVISGVNWFRFDWRSSVKVIISDYFEGKLNCDTGTLHLNG